MEKAAPATHHASHDDQENDGTGRIVTTLGSSGKWRVVEGSRQWVLQRRDGPNVWVGIAFVSEKERLLRVMRANSLGTNATIRSLPDYFRPMDAKET